MNAPTRWIEIPWLGPHADLLAGLSLTVTLLACGGGSSSKPGALENRDSAHSTSDGHGHGQDEGKKGAEEHADEVSLSAEAITRHQVAVAPVSKRVLIPTLLVPARVAFNTEAFAHIGSHLQGRLSEIPVRLGDEVKKGQPLVVIESPELGEAQSEYLLKRSARASAEPAVQIAQSAFSRAQGLYEKSQAIALTEVQRREAEYRAAQAALAAATAAERGARERLLLLRMTAEAIAALERTGQLDPRVTITAPLDGQVIERPATLGELVGPARESLLTIADMSRLWVIADVPESRLKDIAVGTAARVLLGSGQDHWCNGTVSFISPALNVATRTVPVRIEPTDRHPELRPGVFAQAEIALKPSEILSEPVVAVPEEAIQTVEGRPAVFVPVPGEERTYAKRNLVVDRAVGGFVPVISGLNEGECFVSRGSFILKAELGKSSAEHDH